MEACRRCKIEKPDSELLPLQPRYKNRICRDCRNADGRRNHAKPSMKTAARARNLSRRYGLSLLDYQQMLTAQSGACAICAKPSTECFDGLLHVDHCHSTGQVRGLLCPLCNTVLGKMNDNPSLLRKAADYLEDT